MYHANISFFPQIVQIAFLFKMIRHFYTLICSIIKQNNLVTAMLEDDKLYSAQNNRKMIALELISFIALPNIKNVVD